MFHSLIINIEYSTLSRKLGSYRIAHWLRAKGWDAEVIDYANHWTYEELVELAKSRITQNTKFVGFSISFGDWTETIEQFAAWLKLTYPDVVLISGAAIMPDHKILVDYHIWGFGEYALDKLLSYLFSNGEKPNSKIVEGNEVIDASMYPAYPMNDYVVTYEERDFIQPWEFLSIETSRGCRFSCSFCNFSVLGIKGDYSTSSESFDFQMRENFERWGTKNYVIADETFNDRPDKIKKFAKIVEKLNFDPWFAAFIRADLLISRKDDKKLLEDMRVFGQYYGIETFHYPTAKVLKKGMHPDTIKQGLLDVKEFYRASERYRGTISLILGAPLEPMESLHETRQWLINNWSDQAIMFFPLNIPTKNRRKSKLSDIYQNYGYKEVPLERLDTNNPEDKKIMDFLRYHSPNSLVWESPQMNLMDAMQFHKLLEETTREYGFKKPTHSIAAYSGVNSTIEDKLSHTMNQINDWSQEECDWYYHYKAMKLNYTK